MVQVLVIAAMALAGLAGPGGTGAGAGARTAPEPAVSPWISAVVAFAVPLAGGAALLAMASIAARRLDRTGDARPTAAVHRAAMVYRLGAIGAYGAAVLALGWIDAVRGVIGDLPALDELVAASPVWLALTVSFAAWHPFERRLGDAALMRGLDEGRPIHRPPGLWSFVARSWRHQALFLLVPLALITAWVEIVALVSPALGFGPVAAGAAQLAGAACVFAIAPLIIRLTWKTTLVRTGTIHDAIAAMCTRHGVRISGLLVWRTGGTTVNAAVSGVVPWLRYVIISDALLERMGDRHVEAVAAHEIAHVRRRHLPWLALAVLASVTLIGTPAAWLAMPIGAMGAGPAWTTGGVGVVTLVGTLVVLGVVSRRFEWQADAFAAGHLASQHSDLASPGDAGAVGPGAVAVMSRTLGLVAALNGMPRGRWSWRHGSIAERQRRLGALVDRPMSALPIDRRVALWKLGIAGASVLSGAFIAVDVLVMHALASA